MATPEQIAAAWGSWRVRHKGSMGPGPGFVEAIDAALAVSPAATEIESLRRENQELRASRDGYAKQDAARLQEVRRLAIEECARIADVKAGEYEDEARDLRNSDRDRKFSSAVAVRFRGIAASIRALTMSDIHREQLDRPRREAE
jgi:hypothetical protein